jgi:hypothetical protein
LSVDRRKELWGAIRDENKLAFDSHPRALIKFRGLNKSKEGGGYLAERGLLAISKTISTEISAHSVGSSEPERREGERARDKRVCIRLRGSAVKGSNESTNFLIN